MVMASMKMKPEGMDEMKLEEEYGYGLHLKLEDEQFTALGIELPEVGSTVKINAVAIVTKTEIENEGEGEEKKLCLQITEMEVMPNKEKDMASIMFGGDYD